MAGHPDVLIVADGDVDTSLLATLASGQGPQRVARPFVVAADGGAARSLAAGVRPDLVVGDLDSLGPDEQARLGELRIEVQQASTDKDESDLGSCLMTALDRGARQVTILGALGPLRPEHSIANLLLLADPRLDGCQVSMAGRGSRITRVGRADGPGDVAIEGAPGDYVSLLPLGGPVEGVRTSGLRFPLRDESLPVGPSRGLSNELLGTTASVSTRHGCLLVVHTEWAAETAR